MKINKIKKVCFISHTAETNGGAEKSLLTLLQNLPNQILPTVILPHEGPLTTELKKIGVKYIIIEFSWWIGKKFSDDETIEIVSNYLLKGEQLASYLLNNKFDLIYSNTIASGIGAYAAIFSGIPHIWHIREFVQEDFGLDFIFPFTSIVKIINYSTAKTIFVSHILEKKYTESGLSVKSKVIYNGIKKPEKITNQINTRKVDIVVTFYSDPMILKCLDSITKNTSKSLNKVYIIDDCSPYSNLKKKLLSKIANNPTFEYHRNKENRGHIFSTNVGLKKSQGDVIILNSDTIVTKNWIEKLKSIAYQEESIATVTPLSNKASIFSIPKITGGATKVINVDNKPENTNFLLEKIFNNQYLETPTGHGFCMFIKRKVITEIGYLDYKTFKPNYCEENDFCLRASSFAFKNVIALDTYIYHQGQQSYKNKINKILLKNHKVLIKRYPHYTRIVNDFVNQNKLKIVRNTYEVFKNRAHVLKTHKIVTILGSIQPGKGQLEAIKSFNTPEIKNKKYILIIAGTIGDENYHQLLKNHIKANRLSKQIFILPHLPNPTPLIEISDIILSCSKSEAFGRTTAEGMIFGKTIIAANTGANQELVKDKKNGYLYPHGDHLALGKTIYKATNNKKKALIEKNAIKYAIKYFSIDKYTKNISNLLFTINKKKTKNNITKDEFTTLFKILSNFSTKTKIIESENQNLTKQISEYQLELQNLQSQLKKSQADLAKIQSAKTYKLWQKLNKIKKTILKVND